MGWSYLATPPAEVKPLYSLSISSTGVTASSHGARLGSSGTGRAPTTGDRTSELDGGRVPYPESRCLGGRDAFPRDHLRGGDQLEGTPCAARVLRRPVEADLGPGGPERGRPAARGFIAREALGARVPEGRGDATPWGRARAGRPLSERGTYIVIEGIDGTGKTELAARLVPPLLRRGHSVSSFRSPTDKFLRSEYARLSRTDPFAAALCFTVDRALLRPGVESALDQGDVVVQDRSFYSTLAYQAPGLGAEQLRELERIERTVSLEPDLVLYLDAPVEVAIRRMQECGQVDAVEDEPHLQRVRGKFEQMFQQPRWVRIDARGTPEQTIEQAMNAILAAGL